MNYQTADQWLTGRCAESRKIGNNTYLERRDGGKIAVRLHSTDVITFEPSGDFVLNSGGWRTTTTKERINRYSSISLIQRGGLWYIDDCLFYDGIRFSESGELLSAFKGSDKKTEKLIKQIDSYCEKISKLEKIPFPESGDCFCCSLHPETLEEMGESWSGNKHLIDHLKESYIPGSLIWNALFTAGYKDPGFIMQVDNRKNIVQAVRRYLKKSFNIAY